MKITKLHIYNYKNLNVELVNTSSIIALIGNNGSGKSNILEAISTIFFHLFQKKEKDIPFNFLIEYKFGGNQTVSIEKKNSTIHFKVDDTPRADIQQFLPKQIVALYSGEENRLWEKSYKPLYMTYVNSINKSETSGLGEYNIVPKMLYINKFYWHISLLCLLHSDAPDTKAFCKQTLGITKINSIKFDFNNANYANYTNSSVKAFINLIDKKSEYSIDELKKIISECPFPLDEIYKYLYLAFTPEKKKMLENITIKYNDDNLDIEDFSEGEKKMLLIKAALEFAGLEDSMFLLDEPDAHIHLSNKIQIKNVFKEYLDTRQVILTTHSPTLTDTLDEESLFMLNTGHLVHHKKQEILENVSGEFWNKFQQNAFIASKKPIILLVEGKHDKEHIINAYSVLKEEYVSLEFEIFKLNTETNIEPFLRGLYESDFEEGKLYIGLFDREKAILDKLRNPKNYDKIEGKNFFKIKENGKENTSYFVTTLPEIENKNCDCSIEMMYEYDKWEEAYQRAVQNTLGKTANKSIKIFSEDVLNDAKNILSENSQTFNVEDFKNFRKLFDLILEIQTHRKNLTKGENAEIESSTTKEKVEHPEQSDFIEIFTERRGTKLKAHFFADNTKTILQPGSIITNDVVPSYTTKDKTERNKLRKKFCEFIGDKWIVKIPIEFQSPSGAIKFGVGSNINGWKYWLLETNKQALETVRK